MSARGMLSVVGTAVGGLIGWGETQPAADPADVRDLLADIGLTVGPGDAELVTAIRAFQARTGLRTDGRAGPRTIHLLTRYAREARDRHLGFAA